MKEKPKTVPNANEQTIEQLQERYQSLHTKKIQSETNLQNAKQLLDNLKKEALEKYGTDDLDKLRAKLDAMKAENEEKRKNYQAELDRIETELAAVEEKFASSEMSAASAEGDA